MSLVGKPLLGIVFKTKNKDATYTMWYHNSSNYMQYHYSPSEWLKEKMDFERLLIQNNVNSDRIMAIVRAK